MIKILDTDVFKDATATAATTETNFSVANVQLMPLGKIWRSTADTAQWLKFDLGSAQAVDLFTFHRNNLTTGATVKLFGHTTDLGNSAAAWAGADFSTSNTLTFDEIVAVLFLASTETLQWWFLELEDAANPDTFIEIGRVFGGLSTVPDENFNENFDILWDDNSRVFESEGGSKYSVEKIRPKTFDITFSDIDKANVDIIEAWWENVFMVDPIVVALDNLEEPLSWTRIMQIENPLEWVYGPNNRATTTLRFKELK